MNSWQFFNRGAIHQQANTSWESGRIEESIACYQQIISVVPHDAVAHVLLGMRYLLLGDFKRGWPEYAWFWKAKQYRRLNRVPRWDGKPLQGKRILVYADQGHGDTVQYVRYLRYIKGGHVTLSCQPALKRLLQGCADQIICEGDQTPSYDVQAPIAGLPGIFETTLETIPNEIPYLSVPVAGEQAIAEINRYSGLRVGLVWAGSRHLMVGSDIIQSHQRDCPFEELRPLFNLSDITFFSLQKGENPPIEVVGLAAYLNDFADTAAAIQKLDLVISVDTAVAHLAGALGRPVWTSLQFMPDWRWMLGREDSPWYPTMRLFRQPRPGDWTSVIASVTTQLTELARKHSAK